LAVATPSRLPTAPTPRGGTRPRTAGPAACLPRSTTGSPRGSILLISRRRRRC